LTFKEVDCTEARSEASAEVLAVLYKALGSRLQAVCDLIYIDIIEYQQVKIEGFHRSANAVDKRECSVIATAIDEDKMLIFTVFVAVDIETCFKLHWYCTANPMANLQAASYTSFSGTSVATNRASSVLFVYLANCFHLSRN
jgi:hypothetical protein